MAFYKTVIQMKYGIGRCACDVLSVYIKLVVFRKSVLLFPNRFTCPAQTHIIGNNREKVQRKSFDNFYY